MFRELQWLVLFAAAIHPREIATISSRQDRLPPALRLSKVHRLSALSERSERSVLKDCSFLPRMARAFVACAMRC